MLILTHAVPSALEDREDAIGIRNLSDHDTDNAEVGAGVCSERAVGDFGAAAGRGWSPWALKVGDVDTFRNEWADAAGGLRALRQGESGDGRDEGRKTGDGVEEVLYSVS